MRNDAWADMVVVSPIMRQIQRTAERTARGDLPVLIQGETGTGKELVARAVHRASPRMDGPLVCVNCAAVPAGLMEAEFFGHTAGAFTSASAERAGLFAAARGGSIFLDEIDEADLAIQAKFLRVLERGEIRRVGVMGRAKAAT